MAPVDSRSPHLSHLGWSLPGRPRILSLRRQKSIERPSHLLVTFWSNIKHHQTRKRFYVSICFNKHGKDIEKPSDRKKLQNPTISGFLRPKMFDRFLFAPRLAASIRNRASVSGKTNSRPIRSHQFWDQLRTRLLRGCGIHHQFLEFTVPVPDDICGFSNKMGDSGCLPDLQTSADFLEFPPVRRHQTSGQSDQPLAFFQGTNHRRPVGRRVVLRGGRQNSGVHRHSLGAWTKNNGGPLE